MQSGNSQTLYPLRSPSVAFSPCAPPFNRVHDRGRLRERPHDRYNRVDAIASFNPHTIPSREMSDMRFQDRVVIVTGGAKGIGAGCAAVFCAQAP